MNAEPSGPDPSNDPDRTPDEPKNEPKSEPVTPPDPEPMPGADVSASLNPDDQLFEDPFASAPPPITMREELLGTKGRPDPWAHRRGEPRTFAFCWTLFILTAIAGSVMWVARYAALTSGAYAPAARIMLIVVGVGVTLLWPMVRLSQASPPRPVLMHMLVDTWIVLLPVQVVLWPLVFLAGWPVNIVLGVAANFMAWGVLTGGLLAVALSGAAIEHPRDPRLLRRTLWMLAMIVLTLGAPLIVLAVRMAGENQEWEERLSMFSPLTSVAVLTGRGMLGPQNPITPWQWECMLAVGVTGTLSWITAFVRGWLGKATSLA